MGMVKLGSHDADPESSCIGVIADPGLNCSRLARTACLAAVLPRVPPLDTTIFCQSPTNPQVVFGADTVIEYLGKLVGLLDCLCMVAEDLRMSMK